MEKELIKKFNEINIIYKKIEQIDLLKRVHNLFINDKLFEGKSGDEYNILGIYNEKVKKNYDEAKKYYKMGVEKGNSSSMYNLGFYYNKFMNYKKAKKYYKMAIKKGNIMAMNNLGYFYKNVTKNYELAKKYYNMSIEKGSILGMNNLGFYYDKIEKNYDEAKKYYNMAIKGGNSDAMYNLGDYYEKIEKNYEEAIKYYNMLLIKEGNSLIIIKHKINSCIKKLLDNNIELSPKLLRIVNNFNFDENESYLTKMQLNICKTTWIVPKISKIDKHMLEFITLLKISKMQENLLPYWITKRIGGYLFI